MRNGERPYVICHMLPSIDGRIVIRDWKLSNATLEYERTAATFGADAWIIGRISMEPYAGKARVPVRRNGERIAREDFVAAHDASSEEGRAPARKLKLLSIEKRPGDIVWLRYQVRR